MPRKAKPFWDWVDKSGDCWIWLGNKNSQCYGTVRFRGKTRKAHRVSWVLTFGDIEDEMCVCHRCDNPSCVNPAHLFLGTNRDNVIDRHQKGRSRNVFQEGHRVNAGERCHSAKLTDERVSEIRNRHSNGESASHLSREFGIHSSQVSRIINGKAWTHV